MVNLSLIGGCGVIIQHHSPYVAPVMVNLSSLGCSNVFVKQRVSLSSLIMPIYHHFETLTAISDVYYTWHCCGYDLSSLDVSLTVVLLKNKEEEFFIPATAVSRLLISCSPVAHH